MSSIPDDDFGYADHEIHKLHKEIDKLAGELRSVTEEKGKIEIIIDASHQLLRRWETGDNPVLQQAATEMRAVMVAASVLYHPRKENGS